eukprot:UN01070
MSQMQVCDPVNLISTKMQWFNGNCTGIPETNVMEYYDGLICTDPEDVIDNFDKDWPSLRAKCTSVTEFEINECTADPEDLVSVRNELQANNCLDVLGIASIKIDCCTGDDGAFHMNSVTYAGSGCLNPAFTTQYVRVDAGMFCF